MSGCTVTLAENSCITSRASPQLAHTACPYSLHRVKSPANLTWPTRCGFIPCAIFQGAVAPTLSLEERISPRTLSFWS